jgi:hypothetical protein
MEKSFFSLNFSLQYGGFSASWQTLRLNRVAFVANGIFTNVFSFKAVSRNWSAWPIHQWATLVEGGYLALHA